MKMSEEFCTNILSSSSSKNCRDMIRVALKDMRTHEYYERVKDLVTYMENREIDVEFIEGHTATYHQKAALLRSVIESAPPAPIVCEIGFNAGHSSLNFLTARNDSKVFAFDHGSIGRSNQNFSIQKLYSSVSADYLYEHFPGRFALILGDSTKSIPSVTKLFLGELKCQIIFIDGGHELSIIQADLNNIKKLADPLWNRVIVDDLGTQYEYQRNILSVWENEIYRNYSSVDDNVLLIELDRVFSQHASCVNTPIYPCATRLAQRCNCSFLQLQQSHCCALWCQSLLKMSDRSSSNTESLSKEAFFVVATQDETEWSNAVLWSPSADTPVTSTGFQNCKSDDPGYRQPLFPNIGYVGLGSLVSSEKRRWLRLDSPLDGESIVTDVLLVSFWILCEDDHNHTSRDSMLYIGSGPSKTRRLCFQVDDFAARCYEGYGDLGLNNLGLFMTYADTPTNQGHHELAVWVETWPEKKLSVHFYFANIDACAVAVDTEKKSLRDRKLFEIFPYFGGAESNLVKARLTELDGLVDQYILVESNLTHSGIPKKMVAHLLPDAYRIKRIFADLSKPESYGYLGAVGDLKHAREEMQRDAGIIGLGLHAKPDDLVLISDADEIARRDRIATWLHCARSIDSSQLDTVLPLYLDMHWHVYDTKWLSSRRWGLYGREGAVIVSVAMLLDKNQSYLPRPASAWRRQLRSMELRTYGSPRVRVLGNAGWHLSSFGGSKAVATKLKSYCDADNYGTKFYTDQIRLDRLSEHGIAYYDLLSENHRSFHCLDNRSDVPSFAQENLDTYEYFFGSKPCPTETIPTDFVFDTVEASYAAGGKWMLANAHGIHFEPIVDCDTGDATMGNMIRLQLDPQCKARGLNARACDLATKHLQKACDYELKASAFIGNKTSKQQTSMVLDFQTTAKVPFIIDNNVHTITISATDDVALLAKETCAHTGIPDTQCTNLERHLREVQPPQWLL